MSKKIFANNNPDAYAIVDDDVAETIQQMGLKFYINNKVYFRSTTEIKLPGMVKKKRLFLHGFVWILKAGEEPSSEVDHIDRNSSNNQFENLRLATRKEQQHNQSKRKDNKSGYIGVCYKHDKRGNQPKDYWYSSIMRPSGKHEAKYFPFTPEGKIAAAHWYDTKAIEYHGEFHGELNFQDEIG